MMSQDTAGAVTADSKVGDSEEVENPFRELAADDTYQLPENAPCLLLGFRWDTATQNAVCDLDAVTVFFDDNANPLALVDCVQDTYSNVAALIDDSVYNMEGGLEEDLEKMVLDLTRVENRVTTIVSGVRSMSMTFKAHAVSAIKCVCASLIFRRFANERSIDLAPVWHQRVVSSSMLFGVGHETRQDQQNNVVILFMLSRPNARSPWTVRTIYDELRCRDTTALKHLMSGYVASPACSAVAQKLPSIPALCAALTSKALPTMKDKFFAEGRRGLARDPFVHAVFMHLYQTTKGLHAKADAARVVAMLDELFDQIDINGNDYVDWEEFTSFCIELGIVTGKGANNANNPDFQPDDFSIEYQLVNAASGSGSASAGGGGSKLEESPGHGPGVAFMTYVPELKQIYFAERGCNILKALDSAGRPHHQHEFMDPYFVEGSYVTVHTVAYIPGRYLAVVCSDHSVNLMKAVKNRRGATHGYHCEAKVMHQLMHTKLLWEPCYQNLISVGSDNHLYQWQLEDMAAGAQRIFLQPEHANTITDLVCIAEKELVVTSSLDRRVCVWQMPTWKLRTSFRDHTLGVQALSYLRGTLLSAGFDWEIIAWDAERLEKIGTMTGHKAPVTAVAQMVCPTNYEDMKAVSADVGFEARVWDLSGCIAGGNTIPCLMVFRLPGGRGNLNGPRHLCLPFDPDLSVKGYSNMLVGGQSITTYAALKIKKEFFVPPAAEYNSSSAHFLSSLRQNVHIWDATSGEYVRKLTNVSTTADIVSVCFALPFERRLVLGTEDGRILLVNYVTGAILDESHPHSAEVTQLSYCKETKTIISADYHGSISITSEIQCTLTELRQVSDIHGPGIAVTQMAYSHRLSKIVTCPSTAEVRVLGFQNLDHVASAVQSAGEPSTGLAFLDRCSVVVLGDLTRVCLWHLDMETFKMTCFSKLSMPVETLDVPMDILYSLGVLRSEQGFTSLKSTEEEETFRSMAAPIDGEAGGNNDLDNRITDTQRCASGSGANEAVSSSEAGTTAELDYDEGEVFIGLGTEGGRLACWALDDILNSQVVAESQLRIEPVPDELCPSLSSSFNPYNQTVQSRTTTGGPSGSTTATTGGGSTNAAPVSTALGDDSPATGDGMMGYRGGAGSVGSSSSAVGTTSSYRRNFPIDAVNGEGEQRQPKVDGAYAGHDPCDFQDDESGGIIVPEAPPPRAVWHGHSGAVARIGSCCHPPCFFSLGEDGYQRTWSSKGQVLGQFALPNASEFQLRHTLFRNPGWSFLLDAVRVRPYHEEMTTSLLDEVEKRRALHKPAAHHSGQGDSQQSSAQHTLIPQEHPSMLASQSTMTELGFKLTTASTASDRYVPETSHMVLEATTGAPGLSPTGDALDAVPVTTAGDPVLALPPVAARPLHDVLEKDKRRSRSRGVGDGRKAQANEGTALPHRSVVSTAADHKEGPAEVVTMSAEVGPPQNKTEAEGRRIALATIEQHRCRTAEADLNGLVANQSSVATSAMPAQRSATPTGVSRLTESPAFSAQSVRQGAILGYYGRAEVETLAAIAKNPSRVAAYNRIVEGKHHTRADDAEVTLVSAVPSSRARSRTVSTSTSAPALLALTDQAIDPRNTPPNCTGGPSIFPDSSLSTSISSSRLPKTPKRKPGASGKGGRKRGEPDIIQGPEAFTARSPSPSPTSRVEKMYRNAAREYGKGYSAGDAMWREVQSDLLSRGASASSRRSASRRQQRRGKTPSSARVGGAGGSGVPVGADWSSSTFLELPELESMPPKGMQRRRGGGSKGSEDGDCGDDGFDDEFDGSWESDSATSSRGWRRTAYHGHSNGDAGGGGASAGNDWFAATSHGREAVTAGPGPMGSANGGKKSAARRRRIREQVLEWCASSSPPPARWDWDWCRRPVSALPPNRVEALLRKIEVALASGNNSASAPLPVSAIVKIKTLSAAWKQAAGIAELPTQLGSATAGSPSDTQKRIGSGCPSAQPSEISSVHQSSVGVEAGTESSSAVRLSRDGDSVDGEGGEVAKASNGGLGPRGDGSGMAHLVSAEAQKRTKQLARLEQKIIALLVKGNHHARRREAQDRRRGHKTVKKTVARGPRPGQLGPHYTLQAVMEFRAAFNFVDEDMSGCLDSEEWRRFLDRFKTSVAVVNMRSMFLHLDKDMSGSVEVGELVPVIFNKASPPQHRLMRHLIEYENAKDAKRISNKNLMVAPEVETLQVEDVIKWFELYDTRKTGRVSQKQIRRILLSLRVPQLSWDGFVRNTRVVQASPDYKVNAEEFAAGFFDAFVL